VVELVYQKIRETGWFPKGTLGVRAQTVTPTMARALGLPQDWGVVLSDVVPGGPGSEAGLQQGDIAVAVDGESVDNQLAFYWRIYQKPLGSPVQLDVVRNGRRVPVTARVRERPGDAFQPQSAISPERNLLLRLGIMGIDLSELAREVRLGTRRPEGVAVLMAAATADRGGVGLKPGDVVYEVNGRPVPGMEMLRTIMDALPPGSPVTLLVEREGTLFYLTFEVP
jgi:serine protease Do